MDDERPVIEVDLAEIKAALERSQQGQGTPEELIDSYPRVSSFRERLVGLV
jgi:hypothetical protein